jgi:Ankyrin repeats (3 copies)
MADTKLDPAQANHEEAVDLDDPGAMLEALRAAGKRGDMRDVVLAAGLRLQRAARKDTDDGLKTVKELLGLLREKSGDSFLLSKADISAVIDFKGDDECTPAHSAGISNSPEVAKLLISHGATLDALNKWGQTPLMSAAGYSHTAVLRLFCEEWVRQRSDSDSEPFSILVRDSSDGDNVAFFALIDSQIEVVRVLFETLPPEVALELFSATNNSGVTPRDCKYSNASLAEEMEKMMDEARGRLTLTKAARKLG